MSQPMPSMSLSVPHFLLVIVDDDGKYVAFRALDVRINIKK